MFKRIRSFPLNTLPVAGKTKIAVLKHAIPVRWFIMGDMHACAIKMLRAVICTGLCSIQSSELRRFENFYKNYDIADPLSLQREDLYKITTLRKNYTSEMQVKILLLGDICCDRGKSDYLILYVLKKIRDTGITVEWILGNHDLMTACIFGVVLVGSNNACLIHPENLRNKYNKDIVKTLMSRTELTKHCYRSSECSFTFPNEPGFSFNFKRKYTLLLLEHFLDVSVLKIIDLFEQSVINGKQYVHLICTHAPLKADGLENFIVECKKLYRTLRLSGTHHYPTLNEPPGVKLKDLVKDVNALIKNLIQALMVPDNSIIYTGSNEISAVLSGTDNPLLFRRHEVRNFMLDFCNNALMDFVFNRETQHPVLDNVQPTDLYLNLHGHVGGGPQFSHGSPDKCNLDTDCGRPLLPSGTLYSTNEADIIGITQAPSSDIDELRTFECISA